MNHRPPKCPHCSATPLAAQLNRPEPVPCWSCGRPLQVRVFPALFRPPVTGAANEQRIADSDAGCFYHAGKRASVVCDGCGRFLCALCDVELQSQHYCPPCIEAGRKQKRLTHVERSRPLYDNVAIGVALGPLLTGLLLPLSPLAIGVAIWGWRKPASLLPRSKARFIVAILLGLLLGAGSVLAWKAVLRD